MASIINLPSIPVETRSYFFETETSLPGNTRLYLLDKKDFIDYSVNSSGVVNNINIRQDWVLLEGLRNLKFEVEPDDKKSGTLYNVSISFIIPTLSVLKTQLIDRLIQNEYVAIIQDRNYNFWVFGIDESVKYQKSKFGSTTDANLFEVKLGNQQRTNQLGVTRAYITTMRVSAFMNNPESPIYTNVNYYNYVTQAASAINFKAVEYPPNNFALTDETYAIVTSGQNIYLPTSPKKGHTITIKDTGDGDVNPVVIKGAGNLIDGENEAYVNTNKGSITLVFVDNKWNTTQ